MKGFRSAGHRTVRRRWGADARGSADATRGGRRSATCLEALEPKRRASLILAIIDGRNHAEIA
jgi:DNA-directed RNA polymerase specialized sigma24 family protein